MSASTSTTTTAPKALAPVAFTFQITVPVSKFIGDILYSKLAANASALNAFLIKLNDLKITDPEVYNKYVKEVNAAKPQINGKQYRILHDLIVLLIEQETVQDSLNSARALAPFRPDTESGITRPFNLWYYTAIEKLVQHNLAAAKIDLFVGGDATLKPTYTGSTPNQTESILRLSQSQDALRDAYEVEPLLTAMTNLIEGSTGAAPVEVAPVDAGTVQAAAALRYAMNMRDHGEENIFAHDQGLPVASARFTAQVPPRYSAALQSMGIPAQYM